MLILANAMMFSTPLFVIVYTSIISKYKGIGVGRSYERITEQYANVNSYGSASMAIRAGRYGKYNIDYLHEPNPHVLMVGSTSSGKTTTMRSFIGRISIAYKIPFLMIDWNGENEGWAKRAGARL